MEKARIRYESRYWNKYKKQPFCHRKFNIGVDTNDFSRKIESNSLFANRMMLSDEANGNFKFISGINTPTVTHFTSK